MSWWWPLQTIPNLWNYQQHKWSVLRYTEEKLIFSCDFLCSCVSAPLIPSAFYLHGIPPNLLHQCPPFLLPNVVADLIFRYIFSHSKHIWRRLGELIVYYLLTKVSSNFQHVFPPVLLRNIKKCKVSTLIILWIEILCIACYT